MGLVFWIVSEPGKKLEKKKFHLCKLDLGVWASSEHCPLWGLAGRNLESFPSTSCVGSPCRGAEGVRGGLQFGEGLCHPFAG